MGWAYSVDLASLTALWDRGIASRRSVPGVDLSRELCEVVRLVGRELNSLAPRTFALSWPS